MLNWFKRRKFQSGALEDPRPPEEKLKDYRLEELVTSIKPVDWKEVPESDWGDYTIRDQNGAGSCVAHSKVLELGMLNKIEEGEFVDLSARDIYTRRTNQGRPGMNGVDACMICINHGATLEPLMPSDNKTEKEINDISDRLPHKEVVGKIFRAKNWIALPFDIDAIASILDTPKGKRKGVNLFFKFARSEWKEVPKITNATVDCHHSIVGIRHTLYKGVKGIVCQDSWGLKHGFNGKRILTEDWFNPVNRRISWASYFEDLCNWDLVKKIDKPKFGFTKNLWMGMKNNDVIMLQDCLKYLDMFPKTQTSTGFFGGITRDAVKKFQEKYRKEVLDPLNIAIPTGYVGELTRKKLNELFS